MTRQTPQTQKQHCQKSPSPSILSVERLNANTQPPASDDAMIDNHNSLTQADNPDTSQHSTTGLNSVSITRGMYVAFYSKNNLIEPGLLKKWKDGLKDERERKRKSKSTVEMIEL
ncbi:hypothetical protein H4Q26_000264 [Puccinia striiformis f. sp. tritici PST-130]|nr:hypothetical protein H4Q26_000264 [Puccinia striiformis f. sp. tritici PST-130]